MPRVYCNYRVDAGGLVTWANLLVASGQNSLGMNRAVKQIATRWLDGTCIAFDPCLSEA